jgi:aspartyl-tRNA(Asn)/glutamyl-tRNA(Gln) amidotransferase subunit C
MYLRRYASVAGQPAALLEDHFEHPQGMIVMEITKHEVEKVAKLARLEITEAEKEAFAKQLSQILTHVEKLKQYDTKGIEPTATVLGQMNVFRDDIIRPSLPVDKALANAPEHEANRFLVPKIIEER